MSTSAPPAIFTQTKRLREAVSLINGLAVKRLPLILNRVLVHLKDRTAAIFNGDELAQLSTLFNLELEQIHTILDSMSYIYEQAAYHLLNSEKLKAQLLDVLQLSEQPATAIAYVWNEQREAYMVNLRERSFGLPLALDSVHYRSHVTMGTDSSSKRKDIHTILSLGLKVEGAATAAAAPQEGEENAAAAAAGQPEQTPKALVVELSPEDLQKLYDTLEKVQSQLDALTDKK